MYIPKKYGLSKVDKCPFCGLNAVVKNDQGVPVCQKHKGLKLDDLKCVCGSWLELHSGKWGPYFRCMNCGNINFKKGLEMNPGVQVKQKAEVKKKETKEEVFEKPKEIRITSDDVEFFG